MRAPRFKPCRCSVTSRRTLTPVAGRSWRTVAPLSMSCIVKPNWVHGCPIVVHAGFLAEISHSVTTCPKWRRSDNEHFPRRRQVRTRSAVAGEGPGAGDTSRGDDSRSRIDGGHVRIGHTATLSRSPRSRSLARSTLAMAMGQQIVFSSGLPAEADKQRQQLSGVLQSLGMTPQDASDGPERRRRGTTCLGRSERAQAPEVHAMSWIGSTSPCASSTLPSASRAGRTRRLTSVRKVLTLADILLNISAGVYGMDRCDVR